ncbi:MAG: CBS domain-containing protein, partial [Pseudobdellovibrio sp.]
MSIEGKTHFHARIKSEGDVESLRPSLDQLYEKEVITLKTTATLFEAAKVMRDKHVGNVVIVEEKNGKSIPVGLVTDRDLVINSIAKKLNPESVKISEIMNKKIVTATEDDDFSDLVKYISEEGVGRLPIVDASGA